jgi:tetratricopeptide (TPR) repeat protein
MQKQQAPALPPPSGIAPARVQVGLERLGSASLIEGALREVQDAVNTDRRSRGAPELDLVSLGDRIPRSVRDNVEKAARDQNLDPKAVVATVGVRLRGDGGDREANEQALPFLEAAVELDDAMAAYTAGRVILDLGRDREQARALLLKSAEGGDAQGQYNLGKMYWDDGDRPKAEDWLEKSEDPAAIELLAQIRAVDLANR